MYHKGSSVPWLLLYNKMSALWLRIKMFLFVYKTCVSFVHNKVPVKITVIVQLPILRYMYSLITTTPKHALELESSSMKV